MKEKTEIELLPGEKILFYSPNRERWENYRFDLMAYIAIGIGIVPYTYLLISILGLLGLVTLSFKSLWVVYVNLLVSVFSACFYSFVIISYLRALKVYKNNYPLVLTNKRIIKERDFLSKKKPIGTFIEGAEKVAYIEVSRRVAYVYFKKDGEIKKVPLSYLSKYRDEFKNALKEIFGDRYVERILWKENIPINKELIKEIFRDEQKEANGGMQ